MDPKTHKELPVPDATKNAERAVEVLRVWVNPDQSLHMSVMPAFKEVTTWAALMVDVAHNVAYAYGHSTTLSEREALTGIKNALDAIWEARATMVSGEKKKK